jgi:5S rRNA maturation endonuclease (ribonuclease M5)
MTLDDFLERLENVRPAGNGYVAICPAHDDGENSLSVGEGDNDSLLIKCHAGCSAQEIVTAMGLHLRDLFARSTNYAEPEAIYSYTDEQGEELFQAVRLPGKKFRQRAQNADGEWTWNLDGVRRVIYRLPEVIAAVAAGRTVYITEGEKDAESIRALGYVATTSPMGAGKWRDEYGEVFRGAKVIIVIDRDDPGRKHAETVKANLVKHGAEAIFVLQPKRGKDVTDHLEAGFGIRDLQPLKAAPKRGITTAAELAEGGLEHLHFQESDLPGLQFLAGIPIIFRGGRMYAISAYTGDGKTTTMLQATREWCTAGSSGGYFTLEMSAADLRNKLLAHAGIPLRLTENPWLLREDPAMMARYEQALAEIGSWNLDVIFKTNADADFVTETTRDREYDFVVVDHIHRNPGDRQKLAEEVQKYTNLALEYNIPVILVCQLRKFERGRGTVSYPRPSLQDFRETSQIGDDAAMALAVWRQRAEDGMTFTGGTEILVLKNRYRTSSDDETGRSYMPVFDKERQVYTIGGGGTGVSSEPGILRGVLDTPLLDGATTEEEGAWLDSL